MVVKKVKEDGLCQLFSQSEEPWDAETENHYLKGLRSALANFASKYLQDPDGFDENNLPVYYGTTWNQAINKRELPSRKAKRLALLEQYRTEVQGKK